MVRSRMKSGREFQTVGRQLNAVSVEPVTRYCKQLTVGGKQMLPSVDTCGPLTDGIYPRTVTHLSKTRLDVE